MRLKLDPYILQDNWAEVLLPASNSAGFFTDPQSVPQFPIETPWSFVPGMWVLIMAPVIHGFSVINYPLCKRYGLMVED